MVEEPRKRRPPPFPSASAHKKTRDLPDLTLCHGCGLRWPSTHPLSALESQWRVALLCGPCLARVRSAAACSYCFSDLAPHLHTPLLDCRRCRRRVHLACVPLQRGYVTLSELDPLSFVCIDCCAIPRFRGNPNPSPPFGVSLEDFVGAAQRKVEDGGVLNDDAVVATEPSMIVDDEELALQLHLAMNGSRRISRNLRLRNSKSLVDTETANKEDMAFFVENYNGLERDSSLRLDSTEMRKQNKETARVNEGNSLPQMPVEEDEYLDENGPGALALNYESTNKSNGSVVRPECGEGLAGLLGEERLSTPEQCSKKYGKRNTSLKEMMQKKEGLLAPCQQMSCSESSRSFTSVSYQPTTVPVQSSPHASFSG